MAISRLVYLSPALVLAVAAAACTAPRSEKDLRFKPVSEETRQDLEAIVGASDGATAQLRLLETTDLHVNMEAFDYYRNAPTEEADSCAPRP